MGKNSRARRKKDNTCFAFRKHGTCAFGDSCKFSHDTRTEVGSFIANTSKLSASSNLTGNDEQVARKSPSKLDSYGNPTLEKLQVATSFFPLHFLNGNQANEEDVQYRKTAAKFSGILEILRKRGFSENVFTCGSEMVGRSGFQILRPIPFEQRQFEQLFIPIRNQEKNDNQSAEIDGSKKQLKNFDFDVVEDLYVNFHSNGVALLHLSPFHACLNKEKRKIVKLDFTIFHADARKNSNSHKKSGNLKKSTPNCRKKGKGEVWGQKVDSVFDFSVSGKSKKGGIFLVENHLICKIYCDDCKTYLVRTNIRGRLFEINTKLVKNPEKLYEKNCYLIIVYPKKEELRSIKGKMTTKDEYLLELETNFLRPVEDSRESNEK